MKSKLLFLLALFLWAGSSWGQFVIIGTGTSTSNGSIGDPVERYYNYEHMQIVYLASELTAAGMPVGATINALGFSISESAVSLANYTIAMGSTTQTLATPYIPVAGLTNVRTPFTYAPVVQAAGSFDMITFTSNFTFTGQNIVIDICTGSNPFTTPYGGLRYTAATSGAMRGVRTDGSSNCGLSTTVNYAYRPNIRFNYTASTPNLSAVPGSINFGYVTNGNYGNSQYLLSGVNLTGAPGNIVVTPSTTFFEVSNDNTNWFSTINVPYSSATLTNYPVYVRYVPSGAPATHSATITNVGGGASTNVAVSGTNDLFATYCTSGASSTGDEDITLVQFGSTLNNSSACASLTGSQGTATGTADLYSNFTSITPTDIGQGLTVPISVQITECAGTAYSHDVRVYIDFNQNGLLTDAGEETIIWPYASSNTHTINANIIVPPGATLGNTLMRIVCKESSTTGPCLVSSWGETEDYKVNIIAPPNYQLSWYNLQWPPTGNINQTQNLTVYAQCWEPGVTDLPGPGANILCWIGYSTSNTNPNTWTNWVPAVFNVDVGNNDEYMANLGALQSLTPGTYYYASRFQYNGGPMTYGGYSGGAWDGTSNVSGVLTVTPALLPLPYNQDFPTASFAPYWTQTYSGGVTSNRWSVSNTALAGGAAYEMKATYTSGTGLSRLISPGLDFSTAADPWLSFKTFYDDYGPGVTLKIQTSTDLVNWTDAWTYAGGSGNISASTINVDLPNTGTAPTYVAWVIDGDHYQIDFWHVDDVTVQDGLPAIPGYWTGNADDDWFNTANWADGLVPTSLVDVTIPAGCPNYPLHTDPLKTAVCKKLTILNGGSCRIDSFFDIFSELSVDGGLVIESAALVNVATNIQQAGNGMITINGGNLNVNGFWGGPLFGGQWGGGILNLNGGFIDLVGYLLLGSTDVRMAGPFEFHVHGNAVRFDGSAMTTTPTGGAFYIEPAPSVTDVYVFNSDAGVQSFFDIFFDAGTKNVWLHPTSFGPCGMWTRNFSVLSGKVSTRSSDNLTEMDILTVTGDLDVAANNNANFTTQTVPIAVTGDVNQGLITGSGYGSIISGGNITGNYNLNVTVNPLVAPGRWILISPPVAGLTAAMFQCQYLQRHDPITNTWIDMTPPEPLVPGVDYALWVHPNPIVLPGDPICPVVNPLTNFTWAGIMNSGLVTAPLLYDGDPNEGWNNVGNPFQATIDWTAPGLVKTNVNDAIYFESNGTWATYIGGIGANGGSQYIAPGQGFFVQCNNTSGGSLGFDPSTRTHTRTTFFKNSVPNMVRLQASGNDRSEETVIRFTEEATAGFDGNFDAHNLETSVIGYPTIPQIYSYADGVVLDINSLPATETVPLGFRAGLEGIYTIEATEIQDMPKVDLEDRSTGIITNLLTNSYSFNYKPGDNEQRFLLHFAPLSVDETGKALANIYALDHTVYVNLIDYTKGNIFIYNVSGQQVATSPAAKGMNKVHLRNSGHYVVKVVTETETLVQKVFINQ